MILSSDDSLLKKSLQSASDVMDLYHRKRERGIEYVDINRMQLSMLRQLMEIYKRPDFNLKKQLDVNFSGEQGADMGGGPTKEFFHEAIACLSKVDPAFNIQLFGGSPGHLVPLYGVDAISSECFQMAGKLIAHSILHEGSGFNGLAPAVVAYLVNGSLQEAGRYVTTLDLPDVELRQLLEEKVCSHCVIECYHSPNHC